MWRLLKILSTCNNTKYMRHSNYLFILWRCYHANFSRLFDVILMARVASVMLRTLIYANEYVAYTANKIQF